MQILNHHSARIKTPTTARTAVKPTFIEVEIALPVGVLSAPLAVPVPLTPTAVADPDKPPEGPETPDGVPEPEATVPLALFWKSMTDWLLGALIAKTIPCAQ